METVSAGAGFVSTRSLRDLKKHHGQSLCSGASSAFSDYATPIFFIFCLPAQGLENPQNRTFAPGATPARRCAILKAAQSGQPLCNLRQHPRTAQQTPFDQLHRFTAQ
eukprot:6872573-Prymnesium_polylepis.1